jgi:tRNA(fMet)-specific endonuclease VapC
MTHLLDTNVCIAAMRGNVNVLRHLGSHVPADCGVSIVSLYELYSGVERCQRPAAERHKVDVFVRPLHLLPFDEISAAHSARIRWHLEQRGELIGPYDLMLAGQALALGVALVTHNTREFKRVPGLLLEDWQSAG